VIANWVNSGKPTVICMTMAIPSQALEGISS